MKKAIFTDKVPIPRRPFSQGIISGKYVFLSGFGPTEPGTYRTVGKTIAEQTAYTLKNLMLLLKEAGADEKNIVKINVYLADKNDYDMFNAEYEKFFSDPKPARTTIVCGLVGSFLVEMDCIAYIE